jgi:aspartate kinase
MPVLVQKYGGTSVADPTRIKAVADRVVETRSRGYELVVVVSAMGHTTDQLLALASEITASPPPREMDMLLTAGERITMALLAMALHERGVPAVSYTGSQAGILTDSSHGGARITRITGERVRQSLEDGKVVIVAGFQGVDPESREVTTLGRGGSDTTAVELAAALGAEGCEILTDVSGVFTADPRIAPDAIKLDSISYQDMLAFADAGALVLKSHSVESARDRAVPVHVRSSFTADTGTMVTGDAPDRALVGIAHTADGLITLVGSDVSSLAERIGDMLDAHQIEHGTVDTSERTVVVRVGREQTAAAVRCLHTGLMQLEIKA